VGKRDAVFRSSALEGLGYKKQAGSLSKHRHFPPAIQTLTPLSANSGKKVASVARLE
jgi:hypothetical protein